MKQIRIERHKGYYGKFRPLNIIVDGKKMGAIKQGDSITLDLPSDAKEIWGKMDWATTKRINLNNLVHDKTLVFKGYFSLNPLRLYGILKMPFKVFSI